MNLCKIGLHEYSVVKFETFQAPNKTAKIWFDECCFCKKRRVRKTHKLPFSLEIEKSKWLNKPLQECKE